jgi:DNA repair protein RecO
MVTTMTKEITGLIIRVIDYKESSLIMHLLTDDKIESIMCRGIKKQNSKLKGYILSFNYVKCYVTDSKMPILTDILVLNSYRDIQNNLNKFKYAGLTINMLYKEKYENDKIYQLALKTIDFINDRNEEYYYYTFLLKNLFYMGIGLNKANLDNKNMIGYNISESSIMLSDSNSSIDINKEDTIKLFLLYYSKLEEVIDINLNMLKEFLIKYYFIHASIKL